MDTVVAEAQTVMKHLLDELKQAVMECSICKDSSDADGQPLPLKILPCHHTVCADCLGKLLNVGHAAVIHCPECRRPVVVPDTGVGSLQDNFIAARIRNITDKYLAKVEEPVTSPAELLCGLCQARIQKAEHRCVPCGFLCDSCTWRHWDDKNSLPGKHRVFPTNAANRDDGGGENLVNYCSRHYFCHLDYLCETCHGRAICKLCRQLDHGDHVIREARRAAQDALEETKHLQESTLNRQTQVLEVFKKVQEAEIKAQGEVDQHKKELTLFIQECVGVLQRRELELIGSLEHRHFQVTKSLSHAKDRARNLLACLGSSLEWAERLKKQRDPIMVVREARSMSPALTELLSTPLDSDIADYDESLLAVDTGDLRFNVAAFKYLISLLGKTTSEDGTSAPTD